MKLSHTFLFTLFFSFILCSLGYSQSVVFSDNFDSYTAGQQVACQNSTDWTTWSNAPCGSEDAYVSDTYAYSGANSVIVVDNNDLVHPIANYTSGKYEISFYMYIPSGMDAYWNTLQSFAGGSSIWGMEALYPVGGVCTLNAGGNTAASFSFSYDTWMFNELIVDLDNDLATLKVDGTTEYTWQWSLGATGSGGILQLGGNDFYGYNQTGGSTYYFDDYTVTDLNASPVVTIAYATEDLNGDFVPDHLGDTLTVQGVVIGPNYQTTSISYFIDDGTGGIDIFHYGSTSPTLNLGDEVMVTGEIQQYRGVTEIVPADTSDIVVVSTGNTVPPPMVITISDYLANSEMYESRLVGFVNLHKTSGTWSNGGTIYLTDVNGVDSLKVYLDSDTQIGSNPEPTWPQDVIAIGSQYTTSTPPNDGYEALPRYYDTDFLPPNTLVPVELTSFTAEANGNEVNLKWNTATELNNNVFEIQRNSGTGFITIGSVKGQGTTSQPHSYSFVDNELQSGTYSYRLKQVDFNGSYSYSNTVEVKIMPAVFSLQQNYPNPFNPSTKIQFGLTVDSKVSLTVYNVLGQQVASLINGQLTAGSHTVTFDASNLASGIYLYRINAEGVNGKNFTSVKKMILTK